MWPLRVCSQSEGTLVKLLRDIRLDSERRGLGPYDPGNREPDVLYAWFKHLWANGVRQVGGWGTVSVLLSLPAC